MNLQLPDIPESCGRATDALQEQPCLLNSPGLVINIVSIRVHGDSVEVQLQTSRLPRLL